MPSFPSCWFFFYFFFPLARLPPKDRSAIFSPFDGAGIIEPFFKALSRSLLVLFSYLTSSFYSSFSIGLFNFFWQKFLSISIYSRKSYRGLLPTELSFIALSSFPSWSISVCLNCSSISFLFSMSLSLFSSSLCLLSSAFCLLSSFSLSYFSFLSFLSCAILSLSAYLSLSLFCISVIHLISWIKYCILE